MKNRSKHGPAGSALLMLLALYPLPPVHALQVSDPVCPPAIASPQQGRAGCTRSVADAAVAPETGPAAVESRPAAGGLLNYELQYRRHADDMAGGGRVELGIFNRWGTVSTAYHARGLDPGESIIRQRSSWYSRSDTTDRSLVLGDSIGRAGAWGKHVLFGGVQWGSAFAAQTEFLSLQQPVPDAGSPVPAAGHYATTAAAYPDRPAGWPLPAAADRPAAAGDPMYSLLQRALDRRPDFSPFSEQEAGLLHGGRQNYTYEAGFLRAPAALDGDDYRQAFFAGTHRLGLTDWLTGEVRAEILAGQQTFGLGGTMASLPWLGRLTGAIAGSRAETGTGALANIGFNIREGHFDYRFRFSGATDDFRQLGLDTEGMASRHRIETGLALQLSEHGALSLSYVNLDRRAGADRSFFNAGYHAEIRRGIHLNTFVAPDLAQQDSLAGVILTLRFGNSPPARARDAPADSIHHHQLRHAAADRPGRHGTPGLRAARQRPYLPQAPLEVAARGTHGRYHVKAEPLGDDLAQQVSFRGGVALVNGDIHFTQ